MKKFTGILTVSLIAVMAVGAARADLAATTYVDDAVAGKQDVSNMATGEYESGSITQYPSIKVAETIAKTAAGASMASIGDLGYKNAVETDDIVDGAVTSAKIASGTITNANIATDAAIATSKIAGLDTALNAKEATANKTNTYNAGATDKATKFPTVAAAEAIADAKVAPIDTRVTAAEGNISTLQTNVTNLTNNLDSTINDKIDTALGENGAISEVLADYATNEALSAVRTTANAADSLSKTNETAISNINNATTGILAQAKADATTKANAAETAAKAYADGLAGNYATAAQGAKADTAVQPATMTTELAKKQDKLTAGTNISIDSAKNTISATGLASASDLTSLTTRVTTAEGDIDTLQGTVGNATAGLVKDVADNTAAIAANATGVTEAKAAAVAAQTTADGKVTANAAITAGTGTKITYDAKGLVTGSASLTAADIPSITASKVTDLGALATAAPGACANAANKCVLTFNGTDYAWEVIGR